MSKYENVELDSVGLDRVDCVCFLFLLFSLLFECSLLDNSVGEVGCREGPIMAFSDKFKIDVRGVGGHGANPQGPLFDI